MIRWFSTWFANRRYRSARKEALRAAIDFHSWGEVDLYKAVNRKFYTWEQEELQKPIYERFRNPPSWEIV